MVGEFNSYLRYFLWHCLFQYTDVCLSNQQVPNSLLDAMLVLSCVGIGILLLYWVFIIYKVYKQRTKGNLESKQIKIFLFQTFLFCIGTKNKLDINSKTVEYDAQESSKVINYFRIIHLHLLFRSHLILKNASIWKIRIPKALRKWFQCIRSLRMAAS